MKKSISVITVFLITIFIAVSCGGDQNNNTTGGNDKTPAAKEEPKANPKGIGEVKNVTLTDPLDDAMIASGKAIYEMKCSACHKLTDQRVVGPGWQGITNIRRPEWIMNMITNVDVMLDEDPVARQLLEECLTRMPNQGVAIGDARDILEFMRHNDMEKIQSKDKAVS